MNMKLTMLIFLCSVNLLANRVSMPAQGDFSQSLATWNILPSSGQRVTVKEGVMTINPQKMNLGVNSGYINLRGMKGNSYWLSFKAKVPQAAKGIFACSLKFFTANGKELKQLFAVTGKNFPQSLKWRSHKVKIGQFSRFQFPAQATKMLIRFSYWNRSNSCEGKIMLKDFKLSKIGKKQTSAATNDIVVNVGALQIRFDKLTYWNISGIYYREKNIGIDAAGTYYGTVGNFPKLGFIGSGHRTKLYHEELNSLKITVDGKTISKPAAHYNCSNFQLERRSSIQGIDFISKTTIADGAIFESITFSSEQAVVLNYIYLGMHPWVTSFSDYTTLESKPVIKGKFSGDLKRKINRQIRASAVYNRTLKVGVVTYILNKSPNINWKIQYWDVNKRYRKFYCEVLSKKTLRPYQKYNIEIVTVPFSASAKNWQQQAQDTLNYLKQ